MGEDGTTAMNFTVERYGSAQAEKREREESRRLELKTCSPTPGRLCDVALRPPTAARSNSEPLRPAARHSNAPRRLPRAHPSATCLHAAHPPAARLRAWSASPPAARLRSCCPTLARAPQSHARVTARAKYLPLHVSTCQRPCTQAKYYYRRAYGTHVCHKVQTRI